MRSFRNAAFGLLAAATIAVASDVQQLDKDTFPSFIKEHNLVLAEFFAPWCGHCKALAPEYEQAATELKEKNIPLVKIDCTEEGDLCKEQGVEGYPTVKVFRGPDNVTPYSGARKAPAIVSYMTKQSLPAVTLLTPETIEDFKVLDKVVLVAYIAADDKTSNETYIGVADGLRNDFLFGATNDAELAKSEGVKQPALVLYKSFDEGKVIFDGKIEKDAIEQFAKTASIPLVGEVGPETYSSYMSAGIPLAYIFAETPEERKEIADELKSVAEKHKGKINFATIDAKSFGAHAGNLNLEQGKWPAFAIQDTVKNEKFPYDQTQKLTKKSVGKFVQDFADGKIEPSIKSEPIPEKQEGPVTVVVAHSYKDIVLDDTKDVLLEFYAPWCGHCKALAPKYEELAGLYFNNPSFSNKVVVAKVDATNNDVPDEIQGFPTIKLFPAGSKDAPVNYQGPRTVEDLAKFIKEKGKYNIDAYSEKADEEMPDAESMGKQAPAASEGGVKESVKSVASQAAEAVKTVVADTDDVHDEHDEL
ncbi:MAG: protein disulfide-isomerase precursor [Cirrosporium novae-zelandiae]|nr:MAG: protein disulfide-isomerase precursor [Cirrosporium novae-zelandiae]